MANSNIAAVEATTLKVDLEVDKKKTEEAMKVLKEAFSGVQKTAEKIISGIKNAMNSLANGIKSALGNVGKLLTDAFSVTSMEEYQTAAEQFGEGLAGSLLSMHENIATLETSIVNAVAPIASVLVPIINDAIMSVTGMVTDMGQIVGVGVNNILTLVAPLRQIDFSALITAFNGIGSAGAALTQELFAGLEWAYQNLFVPLAVWTTEGILPAFLDHLSSAISILNEMVVALQPLAVWLWESFLQPIAQWTGGAIVDVLQWLADKLGAISSWISENQAAVETMAVIAGSVAAAIWLVNAATEAWTVINAAWVVVGETLGSTIATINWPVVAVTAAIAALIAIVVLLVKNWDTVKTAVLGAWEAIKGALGSAWQWFRETVVDPVVNGFRGMINGIIGFINGMISGIVQGINAVIGVLNKLQFAVPDWVPGIGGKTLGFNLKTVTAPQIPYLAQGAVLPANKPFMAVVGDQRHGTNIEAPLATIQEAVRVEVGELVSAMLTGFEALLAENRQLRRTVEAIEVGDTVIGQAAARYSHRQSVVKGGAL